MKGLSALVLAGPKKKSMHDEGYEESESSEESGHDNMFSEAASAFLDAVKGGDQEVAIRELKGAIEACITEYNED